MDRLIIHVKVSNYNHAATTGKIASRPDAASLQDLWFHVQSYRSPYWCEVPASTSGWRCYPPILKLRGLRAVVPGIGHLMAPEERQRFADVARKRLMGKGAPKKGEYLLTQARDVALL